MIVRRLHAACSLVGALLLVWLGLAAAPATSMATFAGRNGKLVVQMRSTGALYLIGAHGAHPERITHGAGTDLSASFSPDGEKLVFRRYAADPSVQGIYAVRASGRHQRRIPGTGERDYSPAFGADGRTIAVSQAGQIYSVRLDGSRYRVLTDGARPVFAPDGKRVAFTRYDAASGAAHPYVMRADGTHVRRIAKDGSPSSFSPDGRRLTLERGGSIYVMTLSSRTLRRLTSGRFDDTSAIFSPNGHRIAFLRHEAIDTGDTSHAGVWVMRVDGRTRRRIFTNAGESLDWQALPG